MGGIRIKGEFGSFITIVYFFVANVRHLEQGKFGLRRGNSATDRVPRYQGVCAKQDLEKEMIERKKRI